MDEERRGSLLWIVLFVLALVAALVFGTLWYLRGEDVDRLDNAIRANQTAADATSARLERELRNARSDAESGERKVAELETRVREEQRRSSDAAQQVERRLRGDVDSANARVADLRQQLETLRSQMAEAEAAREDSPSPAAAQGFVADAGAAAESPESGELAETKSQLAEAQARVDELDQLLAERTKERDDNAGTIGDLRASLNNIGLELTSANEALANADSLKKDLADAQAKVKELETKVGDLEANNSHLRAELSSASDDLAKAEPVAKELADVRVQVSQLQETNANLQKRNEELEASHGSLRTELAAAGAATVAAGAAAVKIQDLEAKLADAEKSLAGAGEEAGRLREQVQVFEKEQAGLRDELSGVNRELQETQSKLVEMDLVAGQLDAAKKTIDELHGHIASLEEHRDSLRKDLATAVADLQKARADHETASAIASLEEKLQQAAADLDAARRESATAKTALETFRGNADKERVEASDREKALLADVDKLRNESLSARSELTEFRNRTKAERDAEQEEFSQKMREAIAKVEADAEKRVADAADSSEADTLRQRIANLMREAARVRSAHEAAMAVTGNNLDDAKAAAEKAETRVRELEAANAVLREQSAKDKADWERRLEEAKAELAVPAVPPMSETPIGAALNIIETTSLPVVPADPETITPVPEPNLTVAEPSHYFIQYPERAVGEVSGVTHGYGYRVNLGSRHGVKPGMLFDVHRPLGGMNLFVGVLRVENVAVDTSDAALAPSPGVKICPVTGRAVLTPEMKYSPFVLADGGKPVPLIPAESLDLGGELPALGDKIDNPYFEPGRQLIYALSPSVQSDRSLAINAIEALGGKIVPEGGENIDYQVVETDDPHNPEARPRRIVPGQVASYHRDTAAALVW